MNTVMLQHGFANLMSTIIAWHKMNNWTVNFNDVNLKVIGNPLNSL